MPRYFFNVHDGCSISDSEGTELPDLTAARQVAVRFAGSLLADDQGDFWKGDEWRLDVADDTGATLFSLVFLAVNTSAASKAATPQAQPDVLQ